MWLNKVIIYCVYYLYKSNGMIPFTIIFKPKIKAVNSKSSYVYHITFTITMLVIFFLTLYVDLCALYTRTIKSKNYKLVTIIAFSMISISSIIKSIVLFCSHLIKCPRLKNLLNDGISIHNTLKEMSSDNLQNKPFFDYHCFILLIIKIAIVVTEAISIQVSLVVYIAMSEDWLDALISSCVMYAHSLQILNSCIYYIFMLVALQFFRNSKKCLESYMQKINTLSVTMPKRKKMKIQNYCDLSDSIDRFIEIYNRVCAFTKHINQFSNNYIVVTFFYSFVFLLCDVSFYKL